MAGCDFDPRELVEHIDKYGHGLTEWEINFIANMIDSPPDTYSEKQEANWPVPLALLKGT